MKSNSLGFSLNFKHSVQFFGLKANKRWHSVNNPKLNKSIFNPIFEQFIAYENKNY